MVRALESRANLRPDTNLRTWMMTVLHNVFIDEHFERHEVKRGALLLGQSFERLADLHEPHLPLLGRRRHVHDTMVRALESRANLRPDTNLRTWMMTVLHNVFIIVHEVIRFQRIPRERPGVAPQGHQQVDDFGAFRAHLDDDGAAQRLHR
jgi:DNA-directed RNA polymerase specialized sigma24 family protein